MLKITQITVTELLNQQGTDVDTFCYKHGMYIHVLSLCLSKHQSLLEIR